MADNLLLLYLGWEGVGVCSYLLVGFWYQNSANGQAARKAFIVTRIGDTAMALGLFLLFTELGTLDIQAMVGAANETWQVGDNVASDCLSAIAWWCRGQVSSVATAYLAARCDGWPDAGQCADSCGHHGDCGCLFNCPHPWTVFTGPRGHDGGGIDWYQPRH